jgi:hypothetical protein
MDEELIDYIYYKLLLDNGISKEKIKLVLELRERYLEIMQEAEDYIK